MSVTTDHRPPPTETIATAPAADVDAGSAEVEVVVVPDVDALLSWAAAQPTAGTRRLGERTAQGLARLAQQRDHAVAVDAAAARVIEAQLTLARAEAQLRAAKAGTPAAGATGDSAEGPGVPQVDPGPARRREAGRRARAWAARNNVTCPDRGLVPNHVLAAYRRAHPEDVDAR
ncbi:hypothetical protein [Embleya sp. NPDC020630]|uniref:Lsr2 family DNA-binding protein n=1 Tax=Embleya sp. NPDC020630 TaxID=3363979 RepID=UPI0037B50BA6